MLSWPVVSLGPSFFFLWHLAGVGLILHWCHDKDCSIFARFHKISKESVSVIQLSNLAKFGRETQVLRGATEWQKAWSYKTGFLGNHAKIQRIKALPWKCIGCVRSGTEIPLPTTICVYPPSLIFSTQKSSSIGFQVIRRWLLRLTVLPQTLLTLKVCS